MVRTLIYGLRLLNVDNFDNLKCSLIDGAGCMASIQYCSDSVSLDYYGKKSNSNNSVLHQLFDIQMEPEHFLLRSMDTKIKRKFIHIHQPWILNHKNEAFFM